MKAMSETFDTSQESRGRLKQQTPSNIDLIVLTFATYEYTSASCGGVATADRRIEFRATKTFQSARGLL